MKKITIIGGGASGILLLINLIKHGGTQPLEISLIEKNGCLGGIAYAQAKNFHLLNVPAAKMGAFPDDVEHFYRWLTANDFDFAPGDFVPRKVFNSYLNDLRDEAIANKQANVLINFFKTEVIDVVRENGRTEVLLDDKSKIIADKVVLAFGNFLPPHVRTENQAYIQSEKYFQNPWSEQIPTEISKNSNVLLIGTGLTALDVISSLNQNNHAGKIFALSTHGLLPTVHQKAAVYKSFQSEAEAQKTVRGLLKTVRKHIEKAESDGNNWRAVIDSLRPFTQQLWLELPLIEKRRFLRHLQRRWDVSRHRMPPESYELLQNLKSKNQLQILRGRIRKIDINTNNDFAVTYGKENHVSVDYIINCTGSNSNYAKVEMSLITNLIARGDIKPDALSLGLDAAPNGEIINRNGETSKVLHTFATAHKGILWECTALPDIRGQAEKLALKLLASN